MTNHASASLRPHERLLIACASTRINEQSQRAVATTLSAAELDWPLAVALSVRHGVAQHVARHLRGFADDPRIPPAVAAAFARMYAGNARRNAVLFRETARLLRALAAANIRCRVLKGVALALTTYPDPALRNCADVDILVDAENFGAALRAAESCGFRLEGGPTPPLSHEQRCVLSCPEDILTDTTAFEFDPTITPEILARHNRQVVLEVQRGLFRDAVGFWRRVDLAPFWESPQTAALPDGTPFCGLAPEADLVYLSVHAAVHCFERLIHFLDIAALTQRHGSAMDWERVVHLAARYGVGLHLFRTLELARRALGAEVPSETLRRLAPKGARAAVRNVLALSDVFGAAQAGRGEFGLRRWLYAPTGRERMASLFRLLAPHPDAMRRTYSTQSRARIAALYLIRPFHLAGRLIGALTQRARCSASGGRRSGRLPDAEHRTPNA